MSTWGSELHPHAAMVLLIDDPAFRQESDLAINIRKATSIEETAPKRKHVRSCIVYTWDHKNSNSFWQGMKVYVASISLLADATAPNNAAYKS